MISSGSDPDRRRALLGLAGAMILGGCAARGGVKGVPSQDAGETLDVEGVPLHFFRSGAGPTVVLIHGASGNSRDWAMAVLPELATRHHVVAFDRPGHGLSEWPGAEGARLSEQARRMRAGLARLGLRRAIVVGHSYGGSVALAWALDAPETVSGLALVSAPSQVWPGGLGATTDLLASGLLGPLFAQTGRFLPRSVAEAAVARVFAPQDPPPGYLERLRLDLVLAPATLRANALQLAVLKEQIRAMVPRYSGLPMPVELIHGTADTIVPLPVHSEPLRRQVPHARLTRLDGIGHMPHHAAPDALLDALERLTAA